MSKNKTVPTEVRHNILFFLYRNSYWKNRHTPKENLCNKLSHIPCKEINKELKQLYKDKFIRIKKTFHGDDIFFKY